MVLTIFAALPTASAAHVLASAYGADRENVATLIAQSTLLGCLTLPFWLMVLV
jgi:malonate transporter and related proteins